MPADGDLIHEFTVFFDLFAPIATVLGVLEFFQHLTFFHDTNKRLLTLSDPLLSLMDLLLLLLEPFPELVNVPQREGDFLRRQGADLEVFQLMDLLASAFLDPLQQGLLAAKIHPGFGEQFLSDFFFMPPVAEQGFKLEFIHFNTGTRNWVSLLDLERTSSPIPFVNTEARKNKSTEV
jgi:hypothetical protein